MAGSNGTSIGFAAPACVVWDVFALRRHKQKYTAAAVNVGRDGARPF
jgi:hypothetical protein